MSRMPTLHTDVVNPTVRNGTGSQIFGDFCTLLFSVLIIFITILTGLQFFSCTRRNDKRNQLAELKEFYDNEIANLKADLKDRVDVLQHEVDRMNEVAQAQKEATTQSNGEMESLINLAQGAAHSPGECGCPIGPAIERLRASILEMAAQLKGNAEDISDLKREVSRKETRIEEMEEEVRRKDERHEEMEKRLASANEKIVWVQRELSNKRDRAALLEAESKDDEIESLKNDVHRLMEGETKISDDLRGLRRQMSAACTEIQRIQEDNRLKEKLISAAEGRLEYLYHRLEERNAAETKEPQLCEEIEPCERQMTEELENSRRRVEECPNNGELKNSAEFHQSPLMTEFPFELGRLKENLGKDKERRIRFIEKVGQNVGQKEMEDRAAAINMIAQLRSQQKRLRLRKQGMTKRAHLDAHIHALNKARGNDIRTQIDKILQCKCQSKAAAEVVNIPEDNVLPPAAIQEKEVLLEPNYAMDTVISTEGQIAGIPKEDAVIPSEDFTFTREDLPMPLKEKDAPATEEGTSGTPEEVVIPSEDFTVTGEDLSMPLEEKNVQASEEGTSSTLEEVVNPSEDFMVTGEDLSMPLEEKNVPAAEEGTSGTPEEVVNPSEDFTVTEKDLSMPLEEQDAPATEEGTSGTPEEVVIPSEDVMVTREDLSNELETLNKKEQEFAQKIIYFEEMKEEFQREKDEFQRQKAAAEKQEEELVQEIINFAELQEEFQQEKEEFQREKEVVEKQAEELVQKFVSFEAMKDEFERAKEEFRREKEAVEKEQEELLQKFINFEVMKEEFEREKEEFHTEKEATERQEEERVQKFTDFEAMKEEFVREKEEFVRERDEFQREKEVVEQEAEELVQKFVNFEAMKDEFAWQKEEFQKEKEFICQKEQDTINCIETLEALVKEKEQMQDSNWQDKEAQMALKIDDLQEEVREKHNLLVESHIAKCGLLLQLLDAGLVDFETVEKQLDLMKTLLPK